MAVLASRSVSGRSGSQKSRSVEKTPRDREREGIPYLNLAGRMLSRPTCPLGLSADASTPSRTRSPRPSSEQPACASTPREETWLEPPFAPSDLAVDADSLWITNGDRGHLLRIDPVPGETRDELAVSGGPFAVAVGADAIWVTGNFAGGGRSQLLHPLQAAGVHSPASGVEQMASPPRFAASPDFPRGAGEVCAGLFRWVPDAPGSATCPNG
jgi:hypothetical protein